MPSVVIASTSKTMQKVRGVPLVVDASTSKTQQEDTGLCTSATNNSRPQQHRRLNSISKRNHNVPYVSYFKCLEAVSLEKTYKVL